MLLEKYAPTCTKEIAGNLAGIGEIKKFLASWRKGRALLVHGPTGSCKSTAIKLIAEELGYEIAESHANEKRAASSFFASSQQQGLFKKKKLMLFEDIETMQMRGFSDLISNSEHPVICTIGDAYHLPSSSRKLFKAVRFEKIGETELARLLEQVCRKENIPIERRQIEQLAKAAGGDVRGMLIDLEILRHGAKTGYRDSSENIFSTLRIIFKSMSIENSKIAIDNSEKEPEEIMRWLAENISEEYTDPGTIATAYNYLSKADVFNARIIRRQSWNLQKYLSLAAYGTTIAKSRPSVRHVPYKFPAYPRGSESMLEKISRNLHISKRRATAYIPLLKVLGRRDSEVLEKLGMDEKEAALLLRR